MTRSYRCTSSSQMPHRAGRAAAALCRKPHPVPPALYAGLELASRQKAMKSATDNAQQLIERLTREANQARQAEITSRDL